MDLSRLKGVSRDDATIFRLNVNAGGLNYSWTADDRLIVSAADGTNMATPPDRAFHANVYDCFGDPPALSFQELPAYPHMPMRVIESDYASFWGESCLAVGETIYQALMTTNHPYITPEKTFWPGFRAAGCKLIYSPDGGQTWCNQDGSSPVVWENWDARSRDNMLFFEDGAFSSPNFLQMGRGYAANQDGYVYAYGTEAELLTLFRVPSKRVTDRSAYQFFAGADETGAPTWTADLAKREAIHHFPPGWVASADRDGMMAAGWSVNVVYNEPLGFYMLVAQGMGAAEDGSWFGKPSYLGFYAAKTPWGPFVQFHEEAAWCPGGDQAARAFAPRIPAKFISEDGRSFWLAWTDYQFRSASGDTLNPDKSFLEVVRDITDDAHFARILHEWTARNMKGGKRMQRVELILT